jgi:hypothetical protein
VNCPWLDGGLQSCGQPDIICRVANDLKVQLDAAPATLSLNSFFAGRRLPIDDVLSALGGDIVVRAPKLHCGPGVFGDDTDVPKVTLEGGVALTGGKFGGTEADVQFELFPYKGQVQAVAYLKLHGELSVLDFVSKLAEGVTGEDLRSRLPFEVTATDRWIVLASVSCIEDGTLKDAGHYDRYHPGINFYSKRSVAFDLDVDRMLGKIYPRSTRGQRELLKDLLGGGDTFRTGFQNWGYLKLEQGGEMGVGFRTVIDPPDVTLDARLGARALQVPSAHMKWVPPLRFAWTKTAVHVEYDSGSLKLALVPLAEATLPTSLPDFQVVPMSGKLQVDPLKTQVAVGFTLAPGQDTAWNDPLGFHGVSIHHYAVELGLGPEEPWVQIVGVAGDLDVGDLSPAGALKINLKNPKDLAFFLEAESYALDDYVSLANVLLKSDIVATLYPGDAPPIPEVELPELLARILGAVQLEDVRFSIVPDAMAVAGVELVTEGFHETATMHLTDLDWTFTQEAHLDYYSGIKVAASASRPVKLGGVVDFRGGTDGSKGPAMRFTLGVPTTGLSPVEFAMDGQVGLLGVRGRLLLEVKDRKLSGHMDGRIFNVIDGRITVRNDLLGRLNSGGSFTVTADMTNAFRSRLAGRRPVLRELVDKGMTIDRVFFTTNLSSAVGSTRFEVTVRGTAMGQTFTERVSIDFLDFEAGFREMADRLEVVGKAKCGWGRFVCGYREVQDAVLCGGYESVQCGTHLVECGWRTFSCWVRPWKWGECREKKYCSAPKYCQVAKKCRIEEWCEGVPTCR